MEREEEDKQVGGGGGGNKWSRPLNQRQCMKPAKVPALAQGKEMSLQWEDSTEPKLESQWLLVSWGKLGLWNLTNGIQLLQSH